MKSIFSFILAAFLMWGLSQSLAFGADVGVETTAAPAQPRGKYLGFKQCAECHAHEEAKPGQVRPIDELGLTDFVSLSEYLPWRAKDKHAQAYQMLNKDLGNQIRNVLGIALGDKNKQCVSCHAPVNNDRPGEDLTFGVTCEGCHGPGSGWKEPHQNTSWRTKSTAEKQQLGMIDLRDPAAKARQCFSCHIGNPSEGKIVTHEMYAAGHPPLPSIEIENQLSSMPAHWKDLSRKNETIRRLFHYDPRQMYRTKSVVLGGVLAYREWLNYLAARSPAKVQAGWPDFAVFDCYGCHHDLKDPKIITWRQKRGYDGIAGRPRLAEWPQALVKLAIFHTASGNAETYNKKYKEFISKVERVSYAQNPKAFPDKKTAMSAAERDAAIGDLIAWLNKLVAEVEASRFDRDATVRLIKKLTAPEELGTPDFSSARQIAGALASLYADLQSVNEKNGAAEKLLAELKTMMDLTLPAKRQTEMSYDPQRFNNQISRLSQLVNR